MRAMVTGLVLAALAGPAVAGRATDALGQCLVEKVTTEDKTAMVRWMVMAFAAHPMTADIVKVDPAALDPVLKGMAQAVERLLLEACLVEARTALQVDGQAAIGTAFEMVGSLAGREVVEAPEVASLMSGYVQEMDLARFERLLTGC